MIHSNNHSTTLHHFDSVKWKKRLINLSHKLHRSNNNHHWNATLSATAMAAATEKFIRHPQQRHSIPEIEIHSEDLTASQFANLTGIKTKRNSSNSIYSPTTDMYVEDSSDEEDEEDDEDSSRDFYYLSVSSASHHRYSSPQQMRIWDSHFWQDHRKSLLLPISTTNCMKKIASSLPDEEKKKSFSSQPLTRHISEPGGAKVPSMIQKGRFKIVWGQDEEPVTKATTTNCVEWKRKRASSSNSSTTTDSN